MNINTLSLTIRVSLMQNTFTFSMLKLFALHWPTQIFVQLHIAIIGHSNMYVRVCVCVSAYACLCVRVCMCVNMYECVLMCMCS